jgi:hypothetical protein
MNKALLRRRLFPFAKSSAAKMQIPGSYGYLWPWG